MAYLDYSTMVGGVMTGGEWSMVTDSWSKDIKKEEMHFTHP